VRVEPQQQQEEEGVRAFSALAMCSVQKQNVFQQHWLQHQAELKHLYEHQQQDKKEKLQEQKHKEARKIQCMTRCSVAIQPRSTESSSSSNRSTRVNENGGTGSSTPRVIARGPGKPLREAQDALDLQDAVHHNALHQQPQTVFYVVDEEQMRCCQELVPEAQETEEYEQHEQHECATSHPSVFSSPTSSVNSTKYQTAYQTASRPSDALTRRSSVSDPLSRYSCTAPASLSTSAGHQFLATPPFSPAAPHCPHPHPPPKNTQQHSSGASQRRSTA